MNQNQDLFPARLTYFEEQPSALANLNPALLHSIVGKRELSKRTKEPRCYLKPGLYSSEYLGQVMHFTVQTGETYLFSLLIKGIPSQVGTISYDMGRAVTLTCND